MNYQKYLYIFFLTLALCLSFFSTSKAKEFFIDEINIQEKLENDFNKEKLINKGFIIAFEELMGKLVQSRNLIKIKDIKLNEIKSMIGTFTIKEEKFIKNSYNLNLGVSFDKNKVLDYLERKNIFPTEIKEENFLFIPILLDQKNDDILVYSKNPFYIRWKSQSDRSNLIKYILPTEDLEDLNIIRENYLDIENFDFEKIIEKYFLENSIVAIFFKNGKEIKVLSKINIKDEKVIKSSVFNDVNLEYENELDGLIVELKTVYEDFWKEKNLINTSIKMPISIQIDSKNYELLSKFEDALNEIDLVSSFSIRSLSKDFIFYELIFNGTPKNFINIIEKQNFNLDTQNKIWILE